MKNKKNIRQDFYFQKAKEENYPARSVYKLKEINDKYQIIKKNDIVLDIGCAPGSWSLYLSEKVGPQGRVVGVDLKNVDIHLPSNIEFIKGDINDVAKNFKQEFDLIVSDAAPKTIGVHALDVGRSLDLAESAFNIVKGNLKQGGCFICKIFEGEGTEDFIKKIKPLFSFVKQFRPKAVRKHSREFYLIAKTYQGGRVFLE